MTEQSFLLLGWIITIAVVAATGFLVYTLIEIRKSAAQSAESLRRAEESLASALKEAEEAMRKLNAIFSDVEEVTHGAREVGASVSDVALRLKSAGKYIDELTARASWKVVGLKAAIAAASEVLIRGLMKKEGGER